MIAFSIKLKPGLPSEEFGKFSSEFMAKAQIVHRAATFKIIESIIAWSRVDTGRMRAGWFPYLRAYNHPFQRSTIDKKAVNQEEVAEGEREGSFQELPTRSIVTNGVQYSGYVEQNVGVFDQDGSSASVPSPFPTLQSALPKFAELYKRSFDRFIDITAKRFKENKGPEEIRDFGPPNVTE